MGEKRPGPRCRVFFPLSSCSRASCIPRPPRPTKFPAALHHTRIFCFRPWTRKFTLSGAHLCLSPRVSPSHLPEMLQLSVWCLARAVLSLSCVCSTFQVPLPPFLVTSRLAAQCPESSLLLLRLPICLRQSKVYALFLAHHLPACPLV